MRRAKWQPSPVPCMEFFIYFFGIYNAYFFLIITFNTAKLIIPSVITHQKQLVASERHYYMRNSYKRNTNTSCVGTGLFCSLPKQHCFLYVTNKEFNSKIFLTEILYNSVPWCKIKEYCYDLFSS
jgi:hypothetical protein